MLGRERSTRPCLVTEMLDHPLSVLKFGSSVLKSEEDLPVAALEIYRELRKGHRVVAVVRPSAIPPTASCAGRDSTSALRRKLRWLACSQPVRRYPRPRWECCWMMRAFPMLCSMRLTSG